MKKTNISNLVKNSNLNTKLATLATKAELKADEDEIVKFQGFDLIYFRCKVHFENDGAQKNLVFQPAYKYFKTVTDGNKITVWKSKGLSDEFIKSSVQSSIHISLALASRYINSKLQIRVDGSCLKLDKITFTHKKVVNIFIAYEIDLWLFSVYYFALGNSLFGAVKLATNSDPDKYSYSG